MNGRVIQSNSNDTNNSMNAKKATVIRTSQILVRLPANKASGSWQPHVFRVEIPQQQHAQAPLARLLASEHHIVPSSSPDNKIASKHMRIRSFVSVPVGADRLRNTKRKTGNSSNTVANNAGFRAVQRQRTADKVLLSPASSSFWDSGDLVFAAATPPVTPLGLKTDTQNVSFANSISFFGTTTAITKTTSTNEPTTKTAKPLNVYFSRTPTPELQVPSPSDTLAFFSTSPFASNVLHDDAYLALQDLLFAHEDNNAAFNNNHGSCFNPNIGHLVDGWQKTVSMLLEHQRFCAGI
ncbi:hypothetical protein HK100_001429 [Physocladia obscura]|uniref:Uncharacterized protein n=1 Tax=Physocladia obscura TaxID=109957 RepID=A0AAD5SX46_9FUNG|nr:hypothetical protein HK100_001429 [Physocladia obscura]